MAALVSTRQSGRLLLVGTTQSIEHLVGHVLAHTLDDENPVLFDQSSSWLDLDAQTGAVNEDVHLPRGDTDLIAQRLRNYHATCPINGGLHTMRLPFQW